ncbi:MAG TPA: MotA/TolQ/ExbB proton channel family protein [Anaeromyxobacter sp.]|nr:MotA/TolQ/ExbB proton channel family protein [Anaeromyxobacter sp.]
MTQAIFHLFTRAGAEWVMDLLAALSVASIAVILERGLYFLRRGTEIHGLLDLLKEGRLEEARARVGDRKGLEAEVARAALGAAEGGPTAVQEAVACAVAGARPAYERGLSFLGTLGNNAPFLGLFGTVVGIIRAFSDLAVGGPRGAAASTVMAGISEALVATAVGIFVAIPAVVGFNAYMRRLRTLTTRGEAIGHALASHLSRDDVRATALAGVARPEPGVRARPGAA